MRFVVFLVAAVCPDRGINSGGYQAIRLGMTEREVVSIMMAPAGDHRLFQENPLDILDNTGELWLSIRLMVLGIHYSHYWTSDFGQVCIQFDERGKVSRKHFSPVHNWMDNVKDWKDKLKERNTRPLARQ